MCGFIGMTASYLIVGGSSDIALILGQQLIDSGHSITLLARDSSRCDILQNQGAQIVEGDALDGTTVAKAVELAKENGDGAIAGVAHLVGSLLIRPPHAVKIEAFNEVVHTNLSSAFLTLSTACKSMLRSGGGRLVLSLIHI